MMPFRSRSKKRVGVVDPGLVVALGLAMACWMLIPAAILAGLLQAPRPPIDREEPTL